MRSGSAPGYLSSPSPADRCRAVLLDDYTLTNAEVALRARSTPRQQVKAVRYELVCRGVIPPEPPHSSCPAPVQGPSPCPSQLAEGLCVGHPNADCWTSADPARRGAGSRVGP